MFPLACNLCNCINLSSAVSFNAARDTLICGSMSMLLIMNRPSFGL